MSRASQTRKSSNVGLEVMRTMIVTKGKMAAVMASTLGSIAKRVSLKKTMDKHRGAMTVVTVSMVKTNDTEGAWKTKVLKKSGDRRIKVITVSMPETSVMGGVWKARKKDKCKGQTTVIMTSITETNVEEAAETKMTDAVKSMKTGKGIEGEAERPRMKGVAASKRQPVASGQDITTRTASKARLMRTNN